MKRLIVFIIFKFFFLVSATNAKIIDYSNCHLYEITLDNNSQLRLLPILKNNTVVKISAASEGHDKIVNLKWSKENFDAYNTYSDPSSPFFVDGSYGWLRLYKGMPGAYDNYIKKYKIIKKFEKYSFSISTENSTITHIYSFSDEWFNLFAKDEGVKKTNSTIYKIKSYSDQMIIGTDESKIYGTGYEREIIIDLKNNTFKENFHTLEKFKVTKTRSFPKVICNNLSSSSKPLGDSYLNYWWALILIVGVIFFVYTQTSKEFNIKNKFKINSTLFSVVKNNIFYFFSSRENQKILREVKNKSKKNIKKNDFKDYLG